MSSQSRFKTPSPERVPPAPPVIAIHPVDTKAAALALPSPVAAAFLDALGLMAGILDRDGRPLAASRLHRICADFHHACPPTRDICLLHNMARARTVVDASAPWCEYHCPNGLSHALAPIMVDGQRAGTLILGQFLLQAPDEAVWRRRARDHGWDEAAYLDALREVPVLSHARIDALMSLLGGYGAAIIGHWEAERAATTASAQTLDLAHYHASAASDIDALLHTVIDDLPGLVALKDKNGRYLMVNHTLAGLYNSTPAAMIGRLNEELRPAPLLHITTAPHPALDAFDGGTSQVVDQSMIDPVSGRTRHFRLTQRLLTSIQGEPRLLIVGQEISELLEAQEATQQAKSRLEFALDLTGDAVWEWDIESGRISHNKQWLSTFEDSSGRLEHSFAEFIARVHEEDRERVLQCCAASATKDELTLEHRMLTHTGREIWLRVRGRVSARDANGHAVRMIGRTTDITVERAAAAAQRIAAVAFESQEGMLVTDSKGRILRVNRAFTELTGYSAAQAIGRTPAMLHSGHHDAAFYQAMWQQIAATGRWQGEIWNRRQNGNSYPEWLAITAVRDDTGEVSNYVGAFLDITAQKEAQTRISDLAFYDPLTGLPNRRLLLDRLPHTSAELRRAGQHGALIFLDIDHFKTLNDTLGHDVGDQFLRLVATRLKQRVREGDMVARLGGDEFVLVLSQLGTTLEAAARTATTIAQKLCTALSLPYELTDRVFYSSASLGVCIFPSDEDSTETLLKQADLALYQAKGAGRNQIHFYSPELQTAVDQRARIETGLRQALSHQNFELYFQPQIAATGATAGAVIGAEALLRWRAESGELIMPDSFITIAEETGLIVPIGNWVIDSACAQLARWASDPRTATLSLSINISERQIRQADFVQIINAAIERHAIAPHRLKLELTESLVIADIENVVAKMLACARSASCSRSTISAPAIPRCRRCASCHSNRSRSTAPLSATSVPCMTTA